jgi:ubiquinone/menaquinone biosynthesis C-methylase UbiE
MQRQRTEPMWLPKTFDLPQNGVALDVGCGFGRSVRWLSEQYDQVIGTDISSQVIDKARELCQEIDNATFYVTEADSLPVEVLPSSIDMVYVFTVFQHIPREYTLGLLQKIQEVLSNNGVVVFNLVSCINEDKMMVLQKLNGLSVTANLKHRTYSLKPGFSCKK